MSGYWSSIGLSAAIALILFLFFTNTFRDHEGVSRWREPVWLAWLMTAAYIFHNFEKYGVDIKSRAFHFPVSACAQYGFDPVDGCPLVPAFLVVAVNIPFIWVALPIAALWCR